MRATITAAREQNDKETGEKVRSIKAMVSGFRHETMIDSLFHARKQLSPLQFTPRSHTESSATL